MNEAPQYIIEYATTGSKIDPTTGSPLWQREPLEAQNDAEAYEKFFTRKAQIIEAVAKDSDTSMHVKPRLLKIGVMA